MDELKMEHNKEIYVGNERFITLLSEEKIQSRIKELGEQISNDYKGKLPIFIGILNGSFLFLSDLIKHVDLNCEIDFFKLSSYGILSLWKILLIPGYQ
jgi:hypoxanthine phosphoribosyltransferase